MPASLIFAQGIYNYTLLVKGLPFSLQLAPGMARKKQCGCKTKSNIHP